MFSQSCCGCNQLSSTLNNNDFEQGLFAELPIKLKERRNSSQSMPPSRKRPNPSCKLEMHQGHRSAPLVTQYTKSDPPTCSRASAAASPDVEPSVARQSPSAALSKARHAFGDSPQLPPGQWSSDSASSAGNAASRSQNPLNASQTPSQPMPFGPQLGSSLPDLEGLMYPSTDPFAYGNQPLSILEDRQMMAPEQQTSFSGSTGTFRIPAGLPSASFDNYNDPTFASSARYGTYAQQQHGSTPVPRGNTSHIQMPESTAEQDMGNLNMDEGLWQQMFKGRTGLTPGVNLDELFGADGGWNPGYMDQGDGRPE